MTLQNSWLAIGNRLAGFTRALNPMSFGQSRSRVRDYRLARNISVAVVMEIGWGLAPTLVVVRILTGIHS
jgi:hypothetical protein